jgi:anti-anti-sigma factor
VPDRKDRPALLSVGHHTQDGRITVAAHGEIDINSADLLAEAIRSACDQAETAVVVDLDEVTFLDSSGIRVLVVGMNWARACGAAYRVVNAHGIVERVLRTVGVLEVLNPHHPAE